MNWWRSYAYLNAIKLWNRGKSWNNWFQQYGITTTKSESSLLDIFWMCYKPTLPNQSLGPVRKIMHHIRKISTSVLAPNLARLSSGWAIRRVQWVLERLCEMILVIVVFCAFKCDDWQLHMSHVLSYDAWITICASENIQSIFGKSWYIWANLGISWRILAACSAAPFQGPCHLSDRALQGVACGYYWRQELSAKPGKAHVILVIGPCRALPADIIGDKNFRQSPARPMSS